MSRTCACADGIVAVMGRSPATSLKSLAEWALVCFALMASTGRAVAQVGRPEVDTWQQTDSAPALDSEAPLTFEGRATQNLPTTVSRRPGPYGRPFLAVLVAVPLVTYVGPLGRRTSEVVSPADRFVTAQLIGVGYVVNPRFRFG